MLENKFLEDPIAYQNYKNKFMFNIYINKSIKNIFESDFRLYNDINCIVMRYLFS
jgi:hypothetical protein